MNRIVVGILSVLAAIFMLMTACSDELDKNPSQINYAQIPYPHLSDYGFFKGELNKLEPVETVVPYEPITSLFTDYAHKARYIWMPEGSSARIIPESEEGEIDFPEHSILIKSFYYPEDFRKPEGEKRIIETRLLILENGKWEAYSYYWNEEQTDAKIKIVGASTPVSWIDEKGEKHDIMYAMPNKGQCKSCHVKDEVMKPIGAKVKNLNCDFDYGNGTANQLQKWADMGYLSNYDANHTYPKLAKWDDPSSGSVEDRARAYLDVNCGHCHNPNGPANTSGFHLNYEEQNPYHWGVGKSPVAAGIGAGSFKYDIEPGKADSSIVTFRMNSIHPGIMMPEVGRVSIHIEGVELIREWINQMEPDMAQAK